VRYCDDCGSAIPSIFSRFVAWVRSLFAPKRTPNPEETARIMRQSVRILENKMQVAEFLNSEWASELPDAKVGDTVRIRKPIRSGYGS